jgi:hypothetical protein
LVAREGHKLVQTVAMTTGGGTAVKARISLDASHSYLIVATHEPEHAIYLLTLAGTDVCYDTIGMMVHL